MEKCFICKEKLKNENHYLCKNCYEKCINEYKKYERDEFDINYSDFFNMDLNKSKNKIKYINCLWDIFEEYNNCDNIINFLLQNNIFVNSNIKNNSQQINNFSLQMQNILLNKEVEELNAKLKEQNPNNSKHQNKSYKCIDGHIVKSKDEKIIDDFLYRNEIAHAYEKQLTLSSGEVIHPDWYIPEIKSYLEYHGVKDNAWYTRMNKYKDNIYETNNIKVLIIDHTQLENIEDILPKLLQESGIKKIF